MKQTYLLIVTVTETFRGVKFNNIEDIHGISEDIDTLKGVADEENYDAPLDWHPTLSGNWEAVNTKNRNLKFEIIKTNNYG